MGAAVRRTPSGPNSLAIVLVRPTTPILAGSLMHGAGTAAKLATFIAGVGPMGMAEDFVGRGKVAGVEKVYKQHDEDAGIYRVQLWEKEVDR